MFNPKTKPMTDEEMISRLESELKQIVQLKNLVTDEHFEKQVNIRLDKLAELYKKLKKK